MSTIITDDDTTKLFDRIAAKNRRHLTLSHELLGVLELTQDERGISKTVERAAWLYLIDTYGLDTIQGAIEGVQRGIDSDARLKESKPYTIEGV